MFLNKDRQKFVSSIGVFIVLQGLAWLSLAIAGIIVKHFTPDSTTDPDISSYIAYLSRIIYDDFIIESTVRLPQTRVIRPQDLEAFLWIYVILSAVWVAASLDQNIAIKYKKVRQSYSTLVLGVAVLMTSIIDLVFVCLLARDYSTCPFELSPAITTASSETTVTTTISTLSGTTTTIKPGFVGTPIDCQVANGIVMTLAARGYVLWLINVFLGISLIRIGAKVLRNPSLLTYGNTAIPRIRLPELRKEPSPNNELAFFGDNDVFTPPAPPMSDHDRNRNSTPVALNNKNQSIYY